LERRQKEVEEQRERRMREAQINMEFNQKAEDEARRMEDESRYGGGRSDRRYNRDDRDRGRRRDTRRRERSESPVEFEIPEGLTEKEIEAVKVIITDVTLSYQQPYLTYLLSTFRHDIWVRSERSGRSDE
jgi:hypothetical protein